MSKKYTTNFLEDTNGSTGSANQVLVSTASGIDWVDGSGSGIIGGPYLKDTTDTFTGSLTIIGDIRGSGQQLILNAGESYSYATGQTNEYVYANAEQGLEINSSPDNWATGWAGRNTTRIGKADGSSNFPGAITMPSGSQLFFDGGGNTYISQDIADRVRFFVGGAEFMRFTESTANDINFFHNTTISGDLTVSGGDITLGGATGRIQGIDTISSGTDAVNRDYVDTEIGNIPSGLAFEGNWNASTDTPTLAGTTQDNGKFWIVSVAGTTNLSGITDWAVGDWAIYVDNGAGTDAWQKVDNSSTLSGLGAANKVAFWSTTANVSFNNNFSYDGTNLTVPRLRVGDGTDGYFYSDSAGRTAFAGGQFYIQDTVGTYYNYATNQYHGNSSGDNHYFRGNPLSGNNWSITAAGAATFTTATITGNTLLGNSNGDYVHINDRLFVGATDSGNAEFWFGEGTTGDVNYGAHWHWDSGYTHKWFTVNNSTETLMMDYATNDASKVNWYRDIDIQDNDILIDSSHGFINSGSWTRNTTPYGNIEFGPANVTWAHIYTDRPNFYFNKELYVNNQRVYNTGYHPEADKWTTARTLTLTGYATGSVSWDGSGNVSMTTAVAKIKAGGNGPSTENLNTVADSVSVGQLEYRGFGNSSSNAPPTSDNANGVISVGQHSGNYGAQLAFSSNGNMYWRDNPGTSFGSWRTMWDSGNDGAGSGLDADLLDGQQGSYYLDYANFTGTPTIPSVGNGQIDGRTSGLGLSGSMDATANQSGNTTFTVTSNAVASPTASTIAYRDSAADLSVRLLRANYANQSTISGAIAFRNNNSTDNYTRYCSSPSAIRTFLGVPASGDLNNYLLNTTDTLTGSLSVTTQVITDSITLTGAFYSRVSNSTLALQRMDTRPDATNYSRTHWYGISDTGATSNFRHAYYDGANYINVTAASGRLTFAGKVAGSTPTAAGDLATKAYVDAHTPGVGVFLPLAGGTLTGNLTISVPDGGSAPAMTNTLFMKGYEGRGIGMKIRDSANSATSPSNREWFVGSGYSNSGFNIGYSATGSSSSYSAQSKFNITTGGDVTIPGNVGIGTTSPTSGRKLDVHGDIETTTSLWIGGTSSTESEHKIKIGQNRSGNGYAYIDLIGDAAAASYYNLRLIRNNTGVNATSQIIHTGTGNFSIDTSDSADIILNPGSGNVGIGITSPGYKLDVSGNARFTATTRHNAGLYTSGTQTRNKLSVWSSLSTYTIGMKSGFGYGGLGGNGTGTEYAMSFQMSNSNNRGWWWGDSSHTDLQGAMSLTTQGKLVVATSIAVGAGESTRTAGTSKLTVVAPLSSNGVGTDFQIVGGSGFSMSNVQVEIPAYGNGIKVNSDSGSSLDNNALAFYQGTAKVGSIVIRTSDTLYSTTSDYRLKENKENISDAIERVKALKPVKFNWISEPNQPKVDGFYAHELAEVVPEAVTGEKDALDYENNPDYQSIDQSKIVPLLSAALQQAIDKIELLEQRIQSIENK